MNIIHKLKELLQQNKQELKKLGVKSIFLFWSYAQNKQNENSDIDLLIDYNNPDIDWSIYWIFRNIEQKLGKKIDIGFTDSIKPEIRQSLKRDLITQIL